MVAVYVYGCIPLTKFLSARGRVDTQRYKQGTHATLKQSGGNTLRNRPYAT